MIDVLTEIQTSANRICNASMKQRCGVRIRELVGEIRRAVKSLPEKEREDILKTINRIYNASTKRESKIVIRELAAHVYKTAQDLKNT